MNIIEINLPCNIVIGEHTQKAVPYDDQIGYGVVHNETYYFVLKKIIRIHHRVIPLNTLHFYVLGYSLGSGGEELEYKVLTESSSSYLETPYIYNYLKKNYPELWII